MIHLFVILALLFIINALLIKWHNKYVIRSFVVDNVIPPFVCLIPVLGLVVTVAVICVHMIDWSYKFSNPVEEKFNKITKAVNRFFNYH